ncbi:MAG TPA: polymer-forming cytoskeletal protein [Alphaproteobacteria bacterium]|jgi:cytoskeletal protein CcmA (bactofilin family)
MFSKAKSDPEALRAKAESRNQVPSIISASLRIVGNLVSAGDVQVDGTVQGDVKSRTLSISQGAAVNGAIEADSVYIQGEVNGQITAQNVVLGATARVIGDVVHSNLVVESGAFLEGHCSHIATVILVEPEDVIPEATTEVADAPSDAEAVQDTRPAEATAA